MGRKCLAPAILAVTVCSVLMTSTPARAGIDVDFGANVRVNDNTDLFFNISSQYFDRDRRVVQDWAPRYPNPDDLSVSLFLCQQSRRSPDFIFSLRRQGVSWFDIGVRVGVPVDAWFVPVEVDPGPPYGHAYGYWKKHRRNPRTRVVLTDMDARNLVAVRMVHEYYRVPVATAMQWRADGRDVRVLMADQYKKRHGREHDRDDDDRGDRDEKHGHDHDHGHDHGHGHDGKHGNHHD